MHLCTFNISRKIWRESLIRPKYPHRTCNSKVFFCTFITFNSNYLSTFQKVRPTKRSVPNIFCLPSYPPFVALYCGVNTARFLKYVWPVYNIMHEMVKFVLSKKFLSVQKTQRCIYDHVNHLYRSSQWKYFIKKGVLENLSKLTGKHLCQCLPATSLKRRF